MAGHDGSRPGWRLGTAAWLMGLGALVEATGVVVLLTGAGDVDALLHEASSTIGADADAAESTARALLVVIGVAATVVWLALAGAVALGARWARWVASAYAVACLAVTGIGLAGIHEHTAWLGVAEAVVAAVVLVLLWVPGGRRPQ